MGWEARKWIQENNENKKIMQNWRIMLKYKKITVKWNKIWKERSACLESVTDCNLSESASIYFQFHMPFSQCYLPIPPSGGGGVYVETKENFVTAWTSKVRLPDFQGWVVEDRHAFPLPLSGHVLWEPWTDREGAWLSWDYCAAETTWRNYLETEIMFNNSQRSCSRLPNSDPAMTQRGLGDHTSQITNCNPERPEWEPPSQDIPNSRSTETVRDSK